MKTLLSVYRHENIYGDLGVAGKVPMTDKTITFITDSFDLHFSLISPPRERRAPRTLKPSWSSPKHHPPTRQRMPMFYCPPLRMTVYLTSNRENKLDLQTITGFFFHINKEAGTCRAADTQRTRVWRLYPSARVCRTCSCIALGRVGSMKDRTSGSPTPRSRSRDLA